MHKKSNFCPICHKKITKPNTWVRFHIRYNPVIEIYACKYCNFAEWALRNKIDLSYNKETVKRIPFVINYQKKFNISL